MINQAEVAERIMVLPQIVLVISVSVTLSLQPRMVDAIVRIPDLQGRLLSTSEFMHCMYVWPGCLFSGHTSTMFEQHTHLSLIHI